MWTVKLNGQYYVANYFTNDITEAKRISDKAVAQEIADCYPGATVESRLAELMINGYSYMRALSLV